MAASLIQPKEKRKLSELEDITNSNTYHNKKMKANNINTTSARQYKDPAPQQQRSPSPTDMTPSSRVVSSPPSKTRSKSVLFATNSFNHQNPHKQYQESPLLTPKEEDDYDEVDTCSSKSNDASNSSFDLDLDNNPDYIALSSTLRLLYSSKNEISGQIRNLSQLLEFHSKTSNKEDVVEFVLKLINNELNLPKQNKVIQTPVIEWTKYHQGLNVGDWSSKDEKPLFKTLHLFDN